jgi:hypothetical protein
LVLPRAWPPKIAIIGKILGLFWPSLENLSPNFRSRLAIIDQAGLVAERHPVLDREAYYQNGTGWSIQVILVELKRITTGRLGIFEPGFVGSKAYY